MSKNFILAHDTGTGGDKAVLIDLARRVIPILPTSPTACLTRARLGGAGP